MMHSTFAILIYFAVTVAPAWVGLRLIGGARNLPAGPGRREMAELAHWSDEISAASEVSGDGGSQ